MDRPVFHVVLHEPEIPNNTGNIGRTCIAAGCALHLVRPLGFDTSEKALRRAGLDYWPRLQVAEHDSWEACRGEITTAALASGQAGAPREPTVWMTSGKGGRPPWEVPLCRGDVLLFGKETRGLPDALLEADPSRVICLPMMPGERGLNLATAVCAVVYEGLRQCVARGEAGLDEAGRLLAGPRG